jgi:TRAP transporter 4TM/12TM fusion protein
MGAGAFVMAELLGIPYLKVVVAAIIPAYLFYLAVFSGVRFEALRRNLPSIPVAEVPRMRDVLKWGRLAPLVLPIAALLTFLLRGFSPTTAGFWASLTAIVLFLFSDFSLSGVKQRLRTIGGGLEKAGIALTEIVALAVCANIVVSLINLTGLGVKLSGFIIEFSGGLTLPALIMGAIVALLLGMGMVTTAAYLIAVSVVGPALILLGIPPMAAHLFIFYFAVISAITPPVCVAAFTASAISGAQWLRVALVSLRLALVAYFMPFLFVYNPALLMMDAPLVIILAIFSATIGAILLSAGLMGYFTTKLHPAIRILFVAGAVGMIVPGWQSDVIGIAIVALVLLSQRFIQTASVWGKRK